MLKFETYLPERLGFPDGSDGKESVCNAGDLGWIPGVGKIPWRRDWLPTPVFLSGEFHGLWGGKGLDMTELAIFVELS